MTPIKVYLDEDVHSFIAEALRLRGWEAQTTVEAGRLRTDDLDQIRYATAGGYALLTYNVSDFPRLHSELLERGESHAGIIVATQEDPKRNVRALLNIANAFSAEDLKNQLLYLNNWA